MVQAQAHQRELALVLVLVMGGLEWDHCSLLSRTCPRCLPLCMIHHQHRCKQGLEHRRLEDTAGHRNDSWVGMLWHQHTPTPYIWCMWQV